MRWFALSVVVLAVAPAPALAQTTALPVDTKIDIQLFRPSPGGTSYFTAESGDVNSSFGLSAGMSVNYARNPLAIYVIRADGTRESAGLVVKNRVNADLLLDLGLFGFADLGVVLPFVYQAGFDEAALADPTIGLTQGPKAMTQGDVRVVPKIRFLHLGEGLFSAALVGTVVVPSAQGAAYAGEKGTVVAPALALSSTTSFIRLALNVGYRLRSKQVDLMTLKVKNELFATAAAGLRLAPALEIIGELYGQTPSDNLLSLKKSSEEPNFAAYQKARTTAEGDLGLRFSFSDSMTLTVGAGGGILPGYGAPAPRVFAAFGYYTGTAAIADSDQDGVPDDVDQCPDKKEDRDGFEDEDGCPDVDNDKDNVADEDDQCPNEPEDKDNYKDEDGCPDPDNDNDGIPDAIDKCPNEPEDFDGFQDDDGCPDLDNDKDGIPDVIDQCPNEPEDKDGYQDEDGCPDPDNDGDGMPDLNDLCPNVSEDFDGVADDDGCPEDNDGDGIPDDKDKCPN